MKTLTLTLVAAGLVAAVVILALDAFGPATPVEEPDVAREASGAPRPGEAGPLPPRLVGRPSAAPAAEAGLAGSGVHAPSAPSAAPARGAEPAAPTPAPLIGRVLDPEGRPIAGARIQAEAVAWGAPAPLEADGRAPVAVSDADGRFRLPRPSGRALTGLRAEADGWALAAEDRIWIPRDGEIEIRMVPACPVAVRVRESESGDPVRGARVEALSGSQADIAPPQRGWPVAVAWTDTEGRAALSVRPGPLRLVALSARHAPAIRAGLNVDAEGLEVDLDVASGSRIEGRVLDAAGKPVAAAHIRAWGATGYERAVKSAPDGTFLLDGLPTPEAAAAAGQDAAVRLRAGADGFVTVSVRVRPEAGNPTPVEIRLVGGRALSGVVVPADGVLPLPRMSITVTPWGSGGGSGRPVPQSAILAPDGTFMVRAVPPGSGEILVEPDGLDPVTVPYHVPENGEAPVVTIVVGEGRARVEVAVLDASGRPVEGAEVQAWPVGLKRGATPRGRPVATDGAGVVRLDVKRDTAFFVVVDAPGHAPFHQHVVSAAAVGGRVEVRLPAGEIRGRVVLPDGRGVQLKLALYGNVTMGQSTMGTVSRHVVETGEDGSFVFRGVGDGVYGVQLRTPGYDLVDRMLRVRTGEDVRVVVADAEASANLRVEVEVKDAGTGLPLSDVEASIYPEGNDGRSFQLLRAVPGAPGIYRSYGTTKPGRYVVRARGRDYLAESATVELVAGREAPRVVLALRRKP